MSSFTIQTKQGLLQNLFSACGVLTDEATFEVTEQGLSFRGMDPSHIAMIDVAIPSTEFSKFEGTTKFGVRVDEALKVVKRFGKEDEITLTEKDSMLVISSNVKTYRQKLIEASTASTPIPKLSFTCKVQPSRDTLKQILGDIAVVSEFVTIEGDKFSGRGDTGEVSLEGNCSTEGEGRATYSLDYVTKMVNAVDEKFVTLEYSSKMPLKLTMGFVSFFLAPRVQD